MVLADDKLLMMMYRISRKRAQAPSLYRCGVEMVDGRGGGVMGRVESSSRAERLTGWEEKKHVKARKPLQPLQAVNY